MADLGPLLFRGAEADVRRCDYLGLASVSKQRAPKSYRHADLDDRIRRGRTKLEALILAEAAGAGVPVPRVLDVDSATCTLLLEHVDGPSLRAMLESRPPDALERCRAFGRLIGRLHGAGLVHGDLTTSNVLVAPRGLVLVDFGLAQRSQELEDRGVDLHLVERTFESSHPDRPDLHQAVVEGYRASFAAAGAVLGRTEEIKGRGRYT